MNAAEIARIVHAAMRQYRLCVDEDPGPKWKFVPDEKKQSIERGVQAVLDDPDILPEDLFKLWKLEHVNADRPEREFHFQTLPLTKQTKSVLFLAVVQSLAALVLEEDEAAA